MNATSQPDPASQPPPSDQPAVQEQSAGQPPAAIPAASRPTTLMIAQAAQRLNLSREAVRHRLRRGTLAGVHGPAGWLVDAASVAAEIAGQSGQGGHEAASQIGHDNGQSHGQPASLTHTATPTPIRPMARPRASTDHEVLSLRHALALVEADRDAHKAQNAVWERVYIDLRADLDRRAREVEHLIVQRDEARKALALAAATPPAERPAEHPAVPTPEPPPASVPHAAQHHPWWQFWRR